MNELHVWNKRLDLELEEAALPQGGNTDVDCMHVYSVTSHPPRQIGK